MKSLATKGDTKTRFDPSVFIDQELTLIVMAFVDHIRTIYTDTEAEEELYQHFSVHVNRRRSHILNGRLPHHVFTYLHPAIPKSLPRMGPRTIGMTDSGPNDPYV